MDVDTARVQEHSTIGRHQWNCSPSSVGTNRLGFSGLLFRSGEMSQQDTIDRSMLTRRGQENLSLRLIPTHYYLNPHPSAVVCVSDKKDHTHEMKREIPLEMRRRRRQRRRRLVRDESHSARHCYHEFSSDNQVDLATHTEPHKKSLVESKKERRREGSDHRARCKDVL